MSFRDIQTGVRLAFTAAWEGGAQLRSVNEYFNDTFGNVVAHDVVGAHNQKPKTRGGVHQYRATYEFDIITPLGGGSEPAELLADQITTTLEGLSIHDEKIRRVIFSDFTIGEGFESRGSGLWQTPFSCRITAWVNS